MTAVKWAHMLSRRARERALDVSLLPGALSLVMFGDHYILFVSFCDGAQVLSYSVYKMCLMGFLQALCCKMLISSR
jgi:hypothetical protein